MTPLHHAARYRREKNRKKDNTTTQEADEVAIYRLWILYCVRFSHLGAIFFQQFVQGDGALPFSLPLQPYSASFPYLYFLFHISY